MKATLFILILFSAFNVKAQLIQKNDTLYINYFIAAGEFGGKNEGLIIHNNEDTIKAEGVRYNNTSYGKALVADTIINFYKANFNNYTVIKEEWVLSKNECEYLAKVLDEIKVQFEEKNVYGNASEHYAIITKDENHVFIDRAGNWNKFLEIKKVLDIEQHPRKL
jgi:hypothetical protein